MSETTVRIAGIVRESIVDGPGFRFVIFTQGCPHHCPGCHNPESHDPKGGYDCGLEKLKQEIQKNPLLRGVTFSGGEPFEQPVPLLELGHWIKEQGLTLMIYTGYLVENLLEAGKKMPEILELISLSDIIVDGPFIEAKKDLNLLFRGSSNQRMIDGAETIRQGKIVEIDFPE